jgi:flagellar biosynthesis/type III secretory pathway chaperone
MAVMEDSRVQVADVAELLSDLSEVQSELLDLLRQKQGRMLKHAPEEIDSLTAREHELVGKLQVCQERRAALLEQAKADGLPGDSIASLAQMVEGNPRGVLARDVKEAAARMRVLQHHSLVNWVLAQRALLHVAQLLEIIATGGRMQPTYGKGAGATSSGNLLNSEA